MEILIPVFLVAISILVFWHNYKILLQPKRDQDLVLNWFYRFNSNTHTNAILFMFMSIFLFILSCWLISVFLKKFSISLRLEELIVCLLLEKDLIISFLSGCIFGATIVWYLFIILFYILPKAIYYIYWWRIRKNVLYKIIGFSFLYSTIILGVLGTFEILFPANTILLKYFCYGVAGLLTFKILMLLMLRKVQQRFDLYYWKFVERYRTI